MRGRRRPLSSAAIFLVLIGLFAPFFMPLPAQAAGGVAITGSLNAHYFQIPQGAFMGGPDINVSVANTGSESLLLNMSTSAETAADSTAVDGIHVGLSPSQAGIVLDAGGTQTFLVSVEVDELVTPGNYRIWVTGEPYRSTAGGGIEILPVVRMSSDLEVVGESGTVHVETVGRSGEPIAAVIRLYRLFNNREYEVAYGDIGILEAKIAPGDFVVKAESKAGEPLAQQSFQVDANENVRISLPVETLYFEGYAVNPAYSTETGELGYAQITYTINNVYQPIPVATVRLVVNFNGELLEGPRIIHTYEPLQVRREGQPYDYRPVDGWRKGTYGLILQLYTGDDLYAYTQELTLDVGGGAAKGSWLWIIFVILGILAAAGLGFMIFFLVKRRKKEEERPRKVEKKRKEEKPTPKAKEPAPKPEPARPLPKEEPIIGPAPLASISSLKARMASLGRDQGTAQTEEEEPDEEEQENPEDAGSQNEGFDAVPPPPGVAPAPPASPKVQTPPAGEKTAGQKTGIFSSVTATPKQEPPKTPGDIQINWPPKPVEPPKPSSFAEAARQRVAAQQPVSPAEESTLEEEPAEPEGPPSRSSFAEAARLRMEARRRATQDGGSDAETGESPTEGDNTGEE